MAVKSYRRTIAILLLFLCLPPASHALDGVTFESLAGNESRIGSLGLQWKWNKKWFESERLEVGGFWDLKFSHWRNTQYLNVPDSTQSINDIGIAATFRLQNRERLGFYAEAATGPHWLSESYDNNNRHQGSRVVFETHAGIGYVWESGLDLGFKAMHMSNGSFRDPNDGVNLYGLNLRYWWR